MLACILGAGLLYLDFYGILEYIPQNLLFEKLA
jgi:hypothetical protein